MTFFVYVYLWLYVCRVTSIHTYLLNNNITIYNESGEYFLLSKSNNYYKEIKCNHHSFCYIQCISNSSYEDTCKNMKITANSLNVTINCKYCDRLKVFAQNTNNFIIKYDNSYKGIFHLENAINIDVEYIQITESIIFAQYAHNFKLQSACMSNNVFHLDYVSKEIILLIGGFGPLNYNPPYLNPYVCSTRSTVIAHGANYLNLTAYNYLDSVNNYSNVLWNGIIYCPYQSDNVCNLNYFATISGTGEIYLADVSLDVSPLNIYDQHKQINSSSSSRYVLWCKQNTNGIYESFTEIYYSSITKDYECKNISSECCYLNNIRPPQNIFCKDNEEICIINCAKNKLNCVNKNIYPSNLTMSLHVICESFDCFNTIIHCPTRLNSLCYVPCDMDDNSCYYTVIKYNSNNQNINVKCKNSCTGLEIFVDKINTDDVVNVNHYYPMNNVNVDMFSEQYNIAFIINIEIKQLMINSEYCTHMFIHALMTQKINITCHNPINQWYETMYIYGKQELIHLNCLTMYSCFKIRIISELQYKLDSLSVDVTNRSCNANYVSNYKGVMTKCEYSGELSQLTDECTCSIANYYGKGPDIFCCPFSTAFPMKHYCDDGMECEISLFNNREGTIIYANHAKSLWLSCQNSTNINIFATNVYEMEIHFIETCSRIQINAMYVETFNMKCSNSNEFSYRNVVIDVSHAKIVNIKAQQLFKTEIYAINATKFTFSCGINCNYLDLAIPTASSFHFYGAIPSILNIYSYNGWNDIENISVANCDKFFKFDSYIWKLYCISPVNEHSNDMNFHSKMCAWNSRLQHGYCECDEIYIYDTFDEFILVLNSTIGSIKNYIHDPWSNECEPINLDWHYGTIFRFALWIVSLLIVIWFVFILSKNIFLKYVYPIKYNEITNIEPPCLRLLLYLYLCDILLWIAQIYLLIVMSIHSDHYNNICKSINSNDYNRYEYHNINYKEHCVIHPMCVWNAGQCTSAKFLDPLLVNVVRVAMSVSTLMLRAMLYFLVLIINFITCNFSNVEFYLRCNCRFKDGIVNHLIFLLYMLTTPVNNCNCCNDSPPGININNNILNQYLQRKLFKISLPRIFYVVIRYMAFFALSWTFYFMYNIYVYNYNELNLNEILPIFVIWIINEMIKIRYRMLSPYDVNKHIEYNINKVFGKDVGYIILMFLDGSHKYDNDDDDTAQQYHQNTVRKKKQSYNSLVNTMVEERSLCISNHDERIEMGQTDNILP